MKGYDLQCRCDKGNEGPRSGPSLAKLSRMLYNSVAKVVHRQGGAIAIYQVSDAHEPLTVTYSELLGLAEYFGTRLHLRLTAKQHNTEVGTGSGTREPNVQHVRARGQGSAGKDEHKYTHAPAHSNRGPDEAEDKHTDVQPYVILCGLYGIQLVVATLAVLWAGGVVVPLDPDLPDVRRDMIQGQTRAGVYMTTQDIQDSLLLRQSSTVPSASSAQIQCVVVSLSEVRKILKREAAGEEFSVEASTHNPSTRPHARPVVRTGKPLSHVIYTSGSTGIPKGVVCSQEAIHKFSTESAMVLGIAESSRVLLTSNPTWDPSVGDIFTTLLAGGILCTAGRAMIVHNLRSAIHKSHATHLFCTPSHWALVGAHPGDLPSVQVLSLGGERIPADMVSAWCKTEANTQGLRMYNVYGTTEGTVYQTWSELHSDRPMNIIGRPLNGVHALVVSPHSCMCACSGACSDVVVKDARTTTDGVCNICGGYNEIGDLLKDLGTDVVGEIVLGGTQTSERYHGDPALTRGRYITFNDVQYFRTGDLGLRQLDGELKVLGRLDTQVKVRGRRVDLGDIESAITTSGCVERVAVVVCDNNRGKDYRINSSCTNGGGSAAVAHSSTDDDNACSTHPQNTSDQLSGSGVSESVHSADSSSAQSQRLVALMVLKEGIRCIDSSMSEEGNNIGHSVDGTNRVGGIRPREFADWRASLETALHIHCRLHLPDYQVPVLFIDLASMPLLANRKLNRSALKEMAEEYLFNARRTSHTSGHNGEGDAQLNADANSDHYQSEGGEISVGHTVNRQPEKFGRVRDGENEHLHEHTAKLYVDGSDDEHQAHTDVNNSTQIHGVSVGIKQLELEPYGDIERFVLGENDEEYEETHASLEQNDAHVRQRGAGKLEGEMERFVARIWMRVLCLGDAPPYEADDAVELNGGGVREDASVRTHTRNDEAESGVSLEDRSDLSAKIRTQDNNRGALLIGPLTHFFNSGGDSLRAIQMLQAIRDEIANLGNPDANTSSNNKNNITYTNLISGAGARSDIGNTQTDASKIFSTPPQCSLQDTDESSATSTVSEETSETAKQSQNSTMRTHSMVITQQNTSMDSTMNTQPSTTTHLTMSDETARGLLCGLHKNPRLKDFVVMLRVAMTTAPDVTANYTAGLNFVEVMDMEDDNDELSKRGDGMPYTDSELFSDSVVLRDEGISSLCRAARMGCIPIVECLLKTKQVPVDGWTSRTCKRMSPLLQAIVTESSVPSAAAYEVQESPTTNTTDTEQTRTSQRDNNSCLQGTRMTCANTGEQAAAGDTSSTAEETRSDKEALLSILLRHGANPWLVNGRGANALHLAAKSGPKSLIVLLRYLFNDTSSHQRPLRTMFMHRDQYAWTCLHYAAWGGHVECVRMLLETAETCSRAVPLKGGPGIETLTKQRKAGIAQRDLHIHTEADAHLQTRTGENTSEHSAVHDGRSIVTPSDAHDNVHSTNEHSMCQGAERTEAQELTALLCAKDRWGRTAIAWAVYRNWIPVITVLANQHHLGKSWDLRPPQEARQRR
ncbi:hypothetical protein SARC_09707 [Sphaeroforma arctica JP610]|uniref:AMP-dependent synthetase/ligase domain-containing protein n=1 Tax=Sphaeroforma arctica JP610 TaxID=667725 RepID=A0A0L0FPE3_9EUKA|nr:hypothetical protein SARC_09707 [Sphaeroforma arctica JP610]KNC77843.1 hypothetical protein SARC_09707 [Sphaeroforma arctica JP610]|eukprot:XP_014151745.1 hypothetical protein SARC_09707 [Sphaeroforma arctica JP610]